MTRDKRKKIQPELQSKATLCSTVHQYRHYGRKNLEVNEDKGSRKRKARRHVQPFSKLFIGAKENNPSLFDDSFSNKKIEQTLASVSRSPLAPLVVSGLHSPSSSLASFNNDTFDRIFSNRNEAVAGNPVRMTASAAAHDSSTQSDETSSNLAGPLFVSLAEGEEAYELDVTSPVRPFQRCARGAVSVVRPEHHSEALRDSDIPSPAANTCKKSNLGHHQKPKGYNVNALSPSREPLEIDSKTSGAPAGVIRKQRLLSASTKTPRKGGFRLTGKLATMRSKRLQATENKFYECEKFDSITVSFTVNRAKENDVNKIKKFSAESEAPYVDEELEDGPCYVSEPLLERMPPKSPVIKTDPASCRNDVAESERLNVICGRDEQLTSTPSCHESSRAGCRERHSSVTPLVARLSSHLGTLSPVLGDDGSAHKVFSPSILLETSHFENDVFESDMVTSAKKCFGNDVPVPVDNSPLSSACDYDTARSSSFYSFHPVGVSKTSCDRDIALEIGMRELKVVVTPLKDKEHNSKKNSQTSSENEPSEGISVSMRHLRRRRNPSIRVRAKCSQKSATKCNTGEKNTESAVVDYPVKLLEKDLIKSSFYYEALLSSVQPSPILTRRQRKARQHWLQNDVSGVITNKKRRRRNIRSLIPTELLSKPTPLIDVSDASAKNETMDDRRGTQAVGEKISNTTENHANVNKDKPKHDTKTRHRLRSDTSRYDMELSRSSHATNIWSETLEKLKRIRNGRCSEKGELEKSVQMKPVFGERSSVLDYIERSSHVVESLHCSNMKPELLEVSVVADLPPPGSCQMPLKRGKGWRRSLSAQVRLSCGAPTASTHEVRGDSSREKNALSTRRSSAHVPSKASSRGKASTAATAHHARVSESNKIPSSAQAEGLLPPVGKCLQNDKVETNEVSEKGEVETNEEASVKEIEDSIAHKMKLKDSLKIKIKNKNNISKKETIKDPMVKDTELKYIKTKEKETEIHIAAKKGGITGQKKIQDEISKKDSNAGAADEKKIKDRSRGKKVAEETILEKNCEKVLQEKETSNISNKTVQRQLTREEAKERILELCGQEDILQLAECFSENRLGSCEKIGEGAYGEVFLSEVDGQKRVFKFIPVEGDVKVNDEVQKTFSEIHSEIIISITLSALREDSRHDFSCSSYAHVLRCWCVRGTYTEHLIALWDHFHAEKKSENDRPDMYSSDQLHIVLEFAPAGHDLECYVFSDAMQTLALFWQVTYGLAVAEEAVEFEHRDLHFGNVLVASCDEQSCVFTLGGQEVVLATQGVRATIIDFTMSRLRCADNRIVYSDLSKEPEIFTGSGDYQFDIYRLMRDALGNDWEKFEPRTNILWLHYLVDKLITECHYKTKATSQHRSYISKLQRLKDSVLQYQSAHHLVNAYDDDKF